MLGIFLAFAVLFVLIKVFEKSRDDLDNFNIATVAIVPVLVVFLTNIALASMEAEGLLLLVVPATVLVLTTFLLLWKNLEIPAGRSALYTVAVLLANEAFALLLILA